MTEFKLQFYPESEILIKEAEPITEFGSYLIDLCTAMVAKMEEEEGVGLAAPQIGISKKLFVYKTGKYPFVVINPQITWVSKQTEIVEEGCLSLPGLYMNIQRPASIRMQYQLIDGVKVEKPFWGMDARVIQHEYDHLFGWLFPFYKIPGAVKGAFKPLLVKPWEYRKLGRLEAL